MPFRATPAVPRGEAALTRTDPVVGAIASFVLSAALDRPATRAGDGPPAAAASSGPSSVQTRTTLLLVRYRYQMVLPGRHGDVPLIAEDARVLGFEGDPGQARWLDDAAASELLGARPDENDRAGARRSALSILADRARASTQAAPEVNRRGAGSRPSSARPTGGSAAPPSEAVRGLRVTVAGRRRHPRLYVYLPYTPTRMREAGPAMPVGTTADAAAGQGASTIAFQAIRPVGGLLPMDMLRRIAAGGMSPPSRPADYHLVGVAHLGRGRRRAPLGLPQGRLAGAARALGEDGGGPRPASPSRTGCCRCFDEHGFGRVQPLHDGIRTDDDGTAFPVSHAWQHLPIHLVAWGTDAGQAAAHLAACRRSRCCSRRSTGPQAHLWGIVSNGRLLRILRDSAALSGVSYLEIDLEAMFDGELFDEFVTLYRLLHASRYEIEDGAAAVDVPDREVAHRGHRRAAPASWTCMRDGVEAALVALGTGLPSAPRQRRLPRRRRPGAGQAGPAAARVPAAVLVRRRGARRPARQDVDQKARDRYTEVLLRPPPARPVAARSGGAHGDLWQAVRRPATASATRTAGPQLGLPGLGGIYDDTDTDLIAPRRPASCSNEYLLAAVRSLSRFYDTATKRYRRVDYLHLGSEELGSIYESLLELVPKWGGRPAVPVPGDRRASEQEEGRRQRAEEDRLLLHPDLAHRLPAGLRRWTRSSTRRPSAPRSPQTAAGTDDLAEAIAEALL